MQITHKNPLWLLKGTESPTFTTQSGSSKSVAHKLPVCGFNDYGFIFCLHFSFLRLLSQSLQSWLRACGLLWTTRPSVPLISGARSRDTLPNSWAASKSSLPPSALTLCAQSTRKKKKTCWFRGEGENELSLSTFASLQSTGRPGVSALLIGRSPQWGEQSDGPPEGVRRGLWPPLVSQHPPQWVTHNLLCHWHLAHACTPDWAAILENCVIIYN